VLLVSPYLTIKALVKKNCLPDTSIK
jgi:hypothetical protein